MSRGRYDYQSLCDAAIKVGHVLQQRGWQLLGVKADRTDWKTDYYDPERWDGIAVHPDYPEVVVAVHVSDWVAKSRSGKEELKTRSEQGETCSCCQGSGRHPNALSYEEARRNPPAQHFVMHRKSSDSRVMHHNIVSPLHYHEDGSPKCLECGGGGHRILVTTHVAFVWPQFQSNPKGCTWHVEHRGEIVRRGSGLGPCADDPGAAESLCDRIEQAVQAVKPEPEITRDPEREAPAPAPRRPGLRP